jgi:hypothetical protein
VPLTFGWAADPPAFCPALGTGEAVGLRCDLTPGHEGDRHIEALVATWRADNTDVRWYVGEGKSGRAVYRADEPVPA